MVASSKQAEETGKVKYIEVAYDVLYYSSRREEAGRCTILCTCEHNSTSRAGSGSGVQDRQLIVSSITRKERDAVKRPPATWCRLLEV